MVLIFYSYGWSEISLVKNITLVFCLIKHSVETAPLLPVEKFSMDLTVFFSNGIEVPPLVTKIIGFFESYDFPLDIFSFI